MAGCGSCGKAKRMTGQTQTFVLQMPDGGETQHGSRLEAEAENARRGGGGTVKTKG